ncbi:MAG: hypothetical protein IJ658_13525 [Kiritimatiellae bacterium]|nr:hypothetical protein [Kiritimatiellia bacterium]
MKTRLYILGLLILAAIGGLLVAHARWLSVGPKDPRFVRFLRRYGKRANAEDILPPHGVAVDERGRPLDVAAPGSTFQHVLDDLSLTTRGQPLGATAIGHSPEVAARGHAPAAGRQAAVPLTLDAALQSRAEELMAGRHGAVVALEPATGRVRALVSAPRAAYLDRSLNGLYPPGSVFKVFVAAAALSTGVDPVLNCPAEGYRSSRSTPPIRDVEAQQAARAGRRWKGFGRIGMAEALAHSSNTYFAQLGVMLGPERFGAAVATAKLREPVTVLYASSLSLEAAGGSVPDGLRAVELAPVAIGQGSLQLSPLSVAMFTAAVADDGVMLAPTLSPTAKPALRARPFTYAAAGRVKKMMRNAVRAGTGAACDIPGLAVCGKTGTAETGRGNDHAWFTCFAPMEAPRLVVTVLVEHGGFGARVALPIARELLKKAQELGYFQEGS